MGDCDLFFIKLDDYYEIPINIIHSITMRVIDGRFCVYFNNIENMIMFDSEKEALDFYNDSKCKIAEYLIIAKILESKFYG